MPKDTDEEKAARKAAMQEALKGCTKTPFEMMELACQALELTRSVVGKLNASAASDLGCAALSLKAAIQGAWLNVLINIGGIQDQAFARRVPPEGPGPAGQGPASGRRHLPGGPGVPVIPLP